MARVFCEAGSSLFQKQSSRRERHTWEVERLTVLGMVKREITFMNDSFDYEAEAFPGTLKKIHIKPGIGLARQYQTPAPNASCP